MGLNLLTTAKELFLDLLFPVKCVVCQKEAGLGKPRRQKGSGSRPQASGKNKLICAGCLKKLKPALSFFCPLCEAKSIEGELCFSCALISGESKPPLDKLIYPFSYREPAIQKTIKAFKYRFIKGLELPLGNLTASYLKKIKKKIDLSGLVLIPVPLHKRKFNQRGYNQSELIAGKIFEFLKSEYPDTEILSDTLIKKEKTKDQADLDVEQRVKNLKSAFKCAKPELVIGRKILLIDDVYTTGTTMAECARVLKEAGAKEIIGLAIARG